MTAPEWPWGDWGPGVTLGSVVESGEKATELDFFCPRPGTYLPRSGRPKIEARGELTWEALAEVRRGHTSSVGITVRRTSSPRTSPQRAADSHRADTGRPGARGGSEMRPRPYPL